MEPALEQELADILAHSTQDFVANNRKVFSQRELAEIKAEAAKRVRALEPRSREALVREWNAVVTDFYENDHWGFVGEGREVDPPKPASTSGELFSFLRTAFFPTLITKALILYFGLMYAMNPGEGYGWGVLIAVVFTLTNFAIFLYKQSRRPDSETEG